MRLNQYLHHSSAPILSHYQGIVQATSQEGEAGLRLQPRPLILNCHCTLLQRLGKALPGSTLLLTTGRLGGLTAVERESGLAAVEQGAKLLAGDLKEGGQAMELALTQAGQLDQPVLELFPDINAQAQAASRLNQAQAALCA